MESKYVFFFFALCAAVYGASLPLSNDIPVNTSNNEAWYQKDRSWSLPPSLIPSLATWEWVKRPAGVLPYKCNFIYGGGYKRMVYVGRVKNGNDIIPAAIHHYGQGGTETVRYIKNGRVVVGNETEWLCATGRIGWARVEDLSFDNIVKNRAIPIGFNSTSHSLLFGCLSHSFFSDSYPATLGVVRNGSCIFEINGNIVSSSDFPWWHTLDLLVAF